MNVSKSSKKEKMFAFPIKGVITSIPESQLTFQQKKELLGKTIDYINGMPDDVRHALAKMIMEQNGVKVGTPDNPLPRLSKKERNKVHTVKIKHEKNSKADKPNVHIL